MTKFFKAVIVLLIAVGFNTSPTDIYALYSKYFIEPPPSSFSVRMISSDLYALSGPIEAGSCEAFKKAIPPEKKNYALVLDSPGGSVVEAVCIGNQVAVSVVRTIVSATVVQNGIGTATWTPPVGRPTVCASACTYIFMAAGSRTLQGNVAFGIHSPGMFKEVTDEMPPELNTFVSGQAVATVMDAFARWNTPINTRMFFFQVPMQLIIYFHPRYFASDPELKKIATKYIEFYGYSN